MEERKTAAIVLSILALIALFFIVILPYIHLKSTHTLSFKNCSIPFKYIYEIDTTDDGYTIAQNKLGLCLCNAYHKKPAPDISKKIMELYKKYGRSVCPDTINEAHYNNLDSVFKYRNKAFDTVLSVD